MQRIELENDIKPISEFRSKATFFLDQVNKTRRPLVITQHGKSAAILMNVRDYELLLDKVELLTDLAAAEEDIKNNRVLSHAKVKAMFSKK